MTLKIGDKEITNVAIGNTPLEDVYLGDKLVWFRHFPTGYELNIPQTTTYEEVPYDQINTFTDRITPESSSYNYFYLALSTKTLAKIPPDKSFNIIYHAHDPSIEDFSLSKRISTNWLKDAVSKIGRESTWEQDENLQEEVEGITWVGTDGNLESEKVYISDANSSYSGITGKQYMGIFEFIGPYRIYGTYSGDDYVTLKFYDN